MEAANLTEFQKIFTVMSRWQTAAEQPLHPTSLQQLLQDEIAAVRVSEFVPHDITRLLQQSSLVQKVLAENKPFGPLLNHYSDKQMASYLKAAREAATEWEKAKPTPFDPIAELIEILNSSARHPVSLASFQNDPLFAGHIRKIHGEEKHPAHLEKPAHPVEVFAHIDCQLRWLIPITVSGEHVHLNVHNGSENPGRIELQAGDLILTNRRNGTEIIHHGAEIIMIEGFVARLSTGELILWS